MIRATEEEKQFQIKTKEHLHHAKAEEEKVLLEKVQEIAIQNGNIFEALMDVTKVCSLGQITDALFKVGGQYRRNM